MSNYLSIAHYIPELILVFIILSVIIVDLVPNLKNFKFPITFLGLGFVAFSLLLSHGDKASIFMDLIVVDPFSHFFKWIFIISTFSVLLISRYSVEVDEENHVEYISLMLMILLGLFLKSSHHKSLILYIFLGINILLNLTCLI